MSGWSNHVPLDLTSVRADLPLACDLYLSKGNRYVLYREATIPFTSGDCERLLKSGVQSLWVRTSTDEVMDDKQLKNLLALSDDQFPPEAKAELLYSSTMAAAKRVATQPVCKETLAEVDRLVGRTVGHLAQSPAAFYALLTVMLHDYSTYTHAANVATYALGLGRFIGILDDKALQEIGLGALLHDVGKARVPETVLNKPGPLSPEEWTVMRQHPVWGTESLASESGLSEVVLKIIRQHHERLDGSGYPGGVSDGGIHPFSLIVALVDSYDAMTSFRPYRPPRTPFSALSILKSELEGKLDMKHFSSFVLLLGNGLPA